jgi:hypothetical protein
LKSRSLFSVKGSAKMKEEEKKKNKRTYKHRCMTKAATIFLSSKECLENV